LEKTAYKRASQFTVFTKYYYCDKINRWATHVARKGEMRNVHTILVLKYEEQRPHERHRNTYKSGFNEIWCYDVEWIPLMVGSYEHGNETSGSEKGVEPLE
jgi:hypothetical protein